KKAVSSLPSIFEPKRRRINLDAAAINNVHKKHSTTVELLDDILSEDDNEPQNSASDQVKRTEELLCVPKVTTIVSESIVFAGQNLNATQTGLLDFLVKRGFNADHDEVESFAREQGTFKNSLISGLNELFYDGLDDLLIEEDEDSIILSQHYYNQLKTV
ncbi:MAG: hypothetical protein EOP04_25005, partial [Proteobacteria bacterium]